MDWSPQLFEYWSWRLARARSVLGPEIIGRIGFFTVVRWGVILNPEKRHSPHKMSYLEHISHYTVFVRG